MNAAGPVNGNQGPAWVDPGWRRTVARYAVSFDEQGLSTTIYDFEIQALDDKGAEAIAQHTVPYNSYFDELSSSELATLKADGSVVAVDERAIRDQPASAEFLLALFRRAAGEDHQAPICRPRRQNQGTFGLQGEAAEVCRRVCALLESGRRPTARSDGTDSRWAGQQAAAYRAAQCRAPRRAVSRADRSSCALPAGDAKAAPDGGQLVRRRQPLRGQQLRRLRRFRRHAERSQCSHGAA